MSSLKNLQRVTYTNEMIMTLIELYKFHGKEFYYKNVLKGDAVFHQRNTILVDSFAFVSFTKINVSENRIRLIIEKESDPKTNDEKLVRNIKDIVSICIKNPQKFEHNSGQVLSLADRLYKDIKRVQFDRIKETGQKTTLDDHRDKTKRDSLDDLFDSFIIHSEDGKNEITNLICNFYIDFINIKPFREDNELIGIFLIYALLLRHGFTQLKYVSFMDVVRNNIETFERLVIEANYNWDSGFSKIEPLNNFIVSNLLKNYYKVERIISDKEVDTKLNKTDNIEYTILKSPEDIFTKEYLQQKHPSVSKSTIDRTLSRLKEEGKIKPLGTGRSAKWHKINMTNDDFSLDTQIDIFSMFDK